VPAWPERREKKRRLRSKASSTGVLIEKGGRKGDDCKTLPLRGRKKRGPVIPDVRKRKREKGEGPSLIFTFLPERKKRKGLFPASLQQGKKKKGEVS